MPTPPPPLPRPTPDRIHDAARTLFTRDGFAAVTVRAIAAEAGVNPALVIRHFGSKEALFLAVMTLSSAPDATGPANSTEPSAPSARTQEGARAARRSRSLLDALAGPLEGLGERLAGSVLAEADTEHSELRDVYVALMRASDRPDVREHLSALTETSLIEPIAARLTGPDQTLRARLVAVQLAGLMTALWVLEDARLHAAERTVLAARYGRGMQALID